ncbi:MAG: GtrA family protein [Bacteroidales bacterium]|nr:GtrA family protein [Bacteroidales bacterium]MBD5287799.1 GtrA family protein [Bacteroides sp.]
MIEDQNEHIEDHSEDRKRGKRVAAKMMKSDSLVYTFLRSIVSSQCSSWTDMAISFALFAWVHLSPFLSTAIGAFVGGVVNCIINYRFTFHATGMSWKAVVVKFALVWAGSLLLNSYGTHALYYLFTRWDWLIDMGFRPDGFFAAARLLTSLIVSIVWNFLLQKYFVFRTTGFDQKIVEFMDRLPFLSQAEKQGE